MFPFTSREASRPPTSADSTDEDTHREVPYNDLEGRPYVVLCCKVCGKDIARKSHGKAIWVHMSDGVEFDIQHNIKTVTVESHEAVPDYIDATATDG